MQTKTLLQQMENRQSQIANKIEQLTAEAKRFLEQKDAIEREAFINRQID